MIAYGILAAVAVLAILLAVVLTRLAVVVNDPSRWRQP